jgi:DNA-binding transcriptional MerR regulator
MAMLATVREKSPEAFRTISEVATELDIPQHVLRFWESRFAQVRPVKRAGGRRYYRPEDVDLLRGIRALLYREGFTIKGAQKVLRDRGLRHVVELGRATIVAPIAFSAPEPQPDEPRHARAVLAVVERAHTEADATGIENAEIDSGDFGDHIANELAGQERARLDALLGELVQLKSRLRAAMPPREG